MGDIELPTPFFLVFHYAWVVFLAFAALTYFVGTWRVKRATTPDSDLRRGCQRVVLVYALVSGLPWLVVGLGTLRGDISSMLSLFSPSISNPVAMFFWLYASALSLGFALWVFFGNGASFLSTHSLGLGMISRTPPQEWQIRVFAALGVVIIAIVLGLLFSGVFPTFGDITVTDQTGA